MPTQQKSISYHFQFKVVQHLPKPKRHYLLSSLYFKLKYLSWIHCQKIHIKCVNVLLLSLYMAHIKYSHSDQQKKKIWIKNKIKSFIVRARTQQNIVQAGRCISVAQNWIFILNVLNHFNFFLVIYSIYYLCIFVYVCVTLSMLFRIFNMFNIESHKDS